MSNRYEFLEIREQEAITNQLPLEEVVETEKQDG
jgi:hypothetical protein